MLKGYLLGCQWLMVDKWRGKRKGGIYLRCASLVTWHTVDVAVLVATAGDVLRAHIPGDLSLDGEEESGGAENISELHCDLEIG